MKISYDQEVDALYIRLVEGDFPCRTLRLSDTVALNIGPEERLVGIEVLDAKRSLNLDDKRAIDLENLMVRLAG
jgi:uncharacterized protein YuzE